MFALEINFKDGVSQPEMILVRRPQALIGGTDYANVVIEDMKPLEYQLRLVRDLGRRFRCKPVAASEEIKIPEILQGVYDGHLSFDAGPLELFISALDIDLALREGEPPDRAGVRVLRQACVSGEPYFPAVVVTGAVPICVSFAPDQSIFVGRSNQCAVRLDSVDVSSKHARLGFEGHQFWIEDLGSTNGTFVSGQQISGRVNFNPEVPVVLGRQITLVGVTTMDEYVRATSLDMQHVQKPSPRRYPVLVSVSEVARPARVVLPLGGNVVIGRDPASDMWLGAPHISRRHCEVSLSASGEVVVKDFSTNGTTFDGGILRKGQSLELNGAPRVLSFGGDLTVAICFSEEQEAAFRAAQGDLECFAGGGKEKAASSRFGTPSAGETSIGRAILQTVADLNNTMSGGRPFKAFFDSLSLWVKLLAIVACISLIVIITIFAKMILDLL